MLARGMHVPAALALIAALAAATNAPTEGPSVKPETYAPTSTPTTATPVTSNPATIAPVTNTPTNSPTTTFSPSASPTTTPTTGGPTGTPVTSTPTTASPVSAAPTNAPTTGSPVTATPASQAPTQTFNPTANPTLSPITRSPTTRTPITATPVTATPTGTPTTGNPTTIAPTNSPTMTPTTGSPVTGAPSETPTTATPVTTAPSSTPTTAAPATLNPSTINPTSTYNPTSTPTTISPTSTPTTGVPTTCGPTTCGPTTCGPTTCGPTTASPITLGPTISQSIVLSTSRAVLREGGTQSYIGVELSRKPGVNIDVGIVANAQIVMSRSTFAFTPGNWNITQYVGINAAADSTYEGHRNYTMNFNMSTDTWGTTVGLDSVNVYIIDEQISYTGRSPDNGWMAGGTVVTVSTLNPLVSSTSTSTPYVECYFGAQRVNGTISGPSSVQCIAPSCQLANGGTACTGDSFGVTLQLIVGHNNPSNTSSTFYYLAEPFVASVSPQTGNPCCGSEVETTITLSALAGSLGATNSSAFCKFGNLVSQATFYQGSSLKCSAPTRYDLRNSKAKTTVDVTVTLNGQQYTTNAGKYEYYDSQNDTDAAAYTILATVVGVVAGLFLIFGGIHWFCCRRKVGAGKRKNKEPVGAMQLLEHISMGLLRDSIYKLPGGKDIISTVELYENKDWGQIGEIRLWKRILSVRCAMTMKDLEFEMGKPFSELDVRIQDAWMFNFRHEFEEGLNNSDLSEKSRLGPFGHWPIVPSKAIDGLISSKSAKRKKTRRLVKNAGDSIVDMGMQIRSRALDRLLKKVVQSRLTLAVRVVQNGTVVGQCRVEERLRDGTLQMKQLSISKYAVPRLWSLLEFQLVPVSRRKDDADLGVAAAIEDDEVVGGGESGSAAESNEASESSFHEQEFGGDEKAPLARGETQTVSSYKSMRRNQVLAKLTVSFYDLFDLSAGQRRLFGVSGEVDRKCIGNVAFLQTPRTLAEATTERKEPAGGNVPSKSNLATASQQLGFADDEEDVEESESSDSKKPLVARAAGAK